jgi:hypothetical protein
MNRTIAVDISIHVVSPVSITGFASAANAVKGILNIKNDKKPAFEKKGIRFLSIVAPS